MQDLQLQDKAVTLLNNLWDEVCDASISRKTVESSWEQNGMEFTIGELKVPAFYFANENKFRYHLNSLLKMRIQTEYWMKAVIQQRFLYDWSTEPCTPRCIKKLCNPERKQ